MAKRGVGRDWMAYADLRASETQSKEALRRQAILEERKSKRPTNTGPQGRVVRPQYLPKPPTSPVSIPGSSKMAISRGRRSEVRSPTSRRGSRSRERSRSRPRISAGPRYWNKEPLLPLHIVPNPSDESSDEADYDMNDYFAWSSPYSKFLVPWDVRVDPITKKRRYYQVPRQRRKARPNVSPPKVTPVKSSTSSSSSEDLPEKSDRQDPIEVIDCWSSSDEDAVADTTRSSPKVIRVASPRSPSTSHSRSPSSSPPKIIRVISPRAPSTSHSRSPPKIIRVASSRLPSSSHSRSPSRSPPRVIHVQSPRSPSRSHRQSIPTSRHKDSNVADVVIVESDTSSDDSVVEIPRTHRKVDPTTMQLALQAYYEEMKAEDEALEREIEDLDFGSIYLISSDESFEEIFSDDEALTLKKATPSLQVSDLGIYEDKERMRRALKWIRTYMSNLRKKMSRH